jgi:hypothetical protein
MIWLAWRQFRASALVAAAVLVVVAVLLAITGPHFADVYDSFRAAQGNCPAGGCPGVNVSILDSYLQLLPIVLVVVPAVIGAFWGAPLISRELEDGTFRLAWTQSVSRTRWLATKLAALGLASVVFTGLFTLMTVWWAEPVHGNRFGAAAFGQNGIAPMGYALFGLALGVTLGVLLRRTVPAMAATLAVFLAVRIAVTYLVRTHFEPAVHSVNRLMEWSGGPGPFTTGRPPAAGPGDWVFSDRIQDASGHAVSNFGCALLDPVSGRPVGPGSSGLAYCDGYFHAVTYQPANRFWTFQLYETALFVGLALLLVGFCFWWIRRRSA